MRPGPLVKEQGMWVFRSGELLPVFVVDEILQQVRRDFDLVHLGEDH